MIKIQFPAVFLSCVLLLASIIASSANPSLIIDVQTGRVLEENQAFDRWSPASLTKLMTAYVTFKEIEAGKITLKAPVTMSANAANNPPSKMGFKVGTVLNVENALRFLIIKSANDVAVALSEAVSGDEAKFVARMNAEARNLGMSGTHFANPNGLSDPNQYSTARDIAILAAAIRKNYPQYDPIFAAEGIKMGDTITPSYNLLLGRYAGADGMKTGYVCESGFNLAASATRNGRTLIAIVLGATSQKTRAEEAVRLLEYGFGVQSGDGIPVTELPRPANASNKTANMRSKICTEEAVASRWDGRQVEGYISFDTPAIKTMTRAPRTISAGLGGASGSSKAAIYLNGRPIPAFPIPNERPSNSSINGLRSTIDALVPG